MRVKGPSEAEIKAMVELGLPMDDAKREGSGDLVIPLSEKDLTLLRGRGVACEIIQADLEDLGGFAGRISARSPKADRPWADRPRT